MNKIFQILTLSFITLLSARAQQVPGVEENIPFLINFGSNAKLTMGDDDFSQAFYFAVPSTFKKPFYIRVFDPEIGGKNDEIILAADSKMKFSVFGGAGIYTKVLGLNSPEMSEKSVGDKLTERTFSNESTFDNVWVSLGPFNPSDGEYVKSMDSFVFKVLSKGLAGDDGNCYKYFLSASSGSNVTIDGANAFTFEYTVRLHDSNKEVSHLYPYIDDKVFKIKQHNFDLDGACSIKIYSKKKIAETAIVSKDGNWQTSLHSISNIERNSCMNFQIINNSVSKANNNNAVFYITNQYGEFLPFMTVPIGDFIPDKIIKAKVD